MKICVYAICKNEINNIDRWIDSMSEADSIVVLDTGSTDGTYEKLKSDDRITKVRQQIIDPWRFDVARNESMKLCPKDSDILVCTDIDEYFNKGWADVLRKEWDKHHFNQCIYIYQWDVNYKYMKYDKIHDFNFEWKRRVHEYLEPIKSRNEMDSLEALNGQIVLYHDQTYTEKPPGYYLDLIKEEYDENPLDDVSSMYLAREYYSLHQYQEAIDISLNYINNSNYFSSISSQELIFRLASSYQLMNNYEEAERWYKSLIHLNSRYRGPYLELAFIYLVQGIPELTYGFVQSALKYSEYLPDNLDKQEYWTSFPHYLLGWCFYEKGDYEEALIQVNEAIKKGNNEEDILNLKNKLLEIIKKDPE